MAQSLEINKGTCPNELMCQVKFSNDEDTLTLVVNNLIGCPKKQSQILNPRYFDYLAGQNELIILTANTKGQSISKCPFRVIV